LAMMKYFKLLKFFLVLFSCAIFSMSCQYFGNSGEIHKNASSPEINYEDRFIVSKTGLVFDKTTGLEWYSGDVTSLDDLGTRFWLSKLNNQDPGWRLPTRDELYVMNKIARKYCRSLDLTRDVFWIKNFRVYHLVLNIDRFPNRSWSQGSLFFNRNRDDEHEDERAHIIVVRQTLASSFSNKPIITK